VDDPARLRGGLLAALGQLGPAAAAALPELLALEPDDVLARVLGGLGPAAAEAAPLLRRLLDSDRATLALAAASALWRLTADPGPALAACRRHLRGDQWAIRGTADVLAELGPVAAEYAAPLLKLARDPKRPVWVRLNTAEALWRVTGDAAAVLPVLQAAWEENRRTRLSVSATLVESGSAAGPLLPLVRTEIAARRRHTADDHGWSSAQVVEDEKLLANCRIILANA
jgi:hypothetical protein